MAKTPEKAGLLLDVQTMRCLHELRDVIRAIEVGELALRRFADVLTEEDGLHREISIRTTFIPKGST